MFYPNIIHSCASALLDYIWIKHLQLILYFYNDTILYECYLRPSSCYYLKDSSAYFRLDVRPYVRLFYLLSEVGFEQNIMS